MKLHGNYPFATTPATLWPLLLDPQILCRVLPGCQSLTPTGDLQFKGQLHIRVGPLAGLYNGTLSLTEVLPQSGYAFSFSAQSKTGGLQGHGRLRLEDQDGLTLLHYELQAEVSGGLQAHATPLLETNARSLVRQSLERLGQLLQTSMLNGVAGVFAETPTTPVSFAASGPPAARRVERRAGVPTAVIPLLALATTTLLIFGWIIARRRRKHA